MGVFRTFEGVVETLRAPGPVLRISSRLGQDFLIEKNRQENSSNFLIHGIISIRILAKIDVDILN